MADSNITPADALDTGNAIFSKAVAFVKHTNENVFLTGKAGTGKTTFLKYIRSNTHKQCAVVAPTGVAAMNAGGETIHSFLQLPLGPFVPGSRGGFGRADADTHDKHSLLAGLRLNENKMKVIRKLELLIIDEVSMVRCDLLDAIDLVLRHVRKNYAKPFGGVQVIFIGDLFQLPPVVTEQDWDILRDFYPSPYFFDAQVLADDPPLYIELKKIYRQNEPVFIDILNRIRNGSVCQADIDVLNERYNTAQPADSGHIMLTTHNRTADNINQQALEQIDKPAYTFKGKITNDFNIKNLPTEETLTLKTGAQVMFIKNDLQFPRRFYNGKIGVVSAINSAGIWVRFPDTDDRLKLEQDVWRNVRYAYDQKNGKIVEEELGSFTQFPVKLAWAITVHKSQGLTLEHVTVDLAQSFASGQVYVALSRCTSIGGLSLRTRLSLNNVITDNRILAFASTEVDESLLDNILLHSRRETYCDQLSDVFSFKKELDACNQKWPELLKKKTGPTEKTAETCEQISALLAQAETHAESFRKQIRYLVAQREDDKLEQRKTAAIGYFTENVIGKCRQLAATHLKLLEVTTQAVARQTKVWKAVDTLLKEKQWVLDNAQQSVSSALQELSA